MNRSVRGRMQCGVGLEERNLRLPDLAALHLRSTFLKFAHSPDDINNGQYRKENINSYEQ